MPNAVPGYAGGRRRGTQFGMAETIRIIGIDPGLRRTGWGIVETCGTRLGFVAAGSVTTDAGADLANRLVSIHDGLEQIIAAYAPDEAAVEATFVNRDAKATLKLGQARGIAMVVPARARLKVAEYAPNVVKKAIVGAGHADKRQIRAMVRVLLPRAVFSLHDEADALAIAVCHAHHRGAPALVAAAGGRR